MEGTPDENLRLGADPDHKRRGPKSLLSARNLAKIDNLDVLKSLISEFCGPIDGLLDGRWQQMPLDKWRTEPLIEFGHKLYEIGDCDRERDRFVDDLIWGLAAYLLVNAVARGAYLESKSSTERHFTKLKHHMFGRATHDLRRQLSVSCKENRSAVLTSVHPNRLWIRNALMFCPMHCLFIRKLPAPASYPRPNVHHISTGTSTRGVILKAMKMLASQPMALLIYPDGPHGFDRMTRNVGPFPMEFGAGASAIAWFSKSDIYFVHPTWTDNGPSMRLTKGPHCENFSELEDYNAVFGDFYAGEIAHLIRNDPRSIVGTASVWKGLIHQTDDEGLPEDDISGD